MRSGFDGENLNKFFADAPALTADEGAGAREESAGVVEVFLGVCYVGFGGRLYGVAREDGGPSGGDGCFEFGLAMLRVV